MIKYFILSFFFCTFEASTSQQNINWNTKLLQAAFGKDTIGVIHAMYKGANINCTDRWGQSPLTMASHSDDHEHVELLLSYNPNLDQVDDKGTTPLIVAAQNGNKKTTKLLLRAGANTEHKDIYSMMALDWARKHKYRGIMKLLGAQDDEIHLMDCPRCQLLHKPKSTTPQLSPPYTHKLSTDYFG